MGKNNDSVDENLARPKLKLNDSEINVYSREAFCVFVDSFAGKHDSWAFDNGTLISGLNIASTLCALIYVNFITEEDIVASECPHVQCLGKLDHNNGESLLDYTQASNRSYDYLKKNDMSLKAATISCIEGLQSATPIGELYSNWVNDKYAPSLVVQPNTFEIHNLKLANRDRGHQFSRALSYLRYDQLFINSCFNKEGSRVNQIKRDYTLNQHFG